MSEHSFQVMSLYKIVYKHKFGSVTFGEKKIIKIPLFPHSFLIEEKHLVAFTNSHYPLQKKHERWIKALSENEVYVYKLTKNQCYSCNYLYGKLTRQNINKDPHISRYLFWSEDLDSTKH